MATCKNPFKRGDAVHFPRGAGHINGTVVKTILRRCHIEADGVGFGEGRVTPGKVFVEDYANVKAGPAPRLVARDE